MPHDFRSPISVLPDQDGITASVKAAPEYVDTLGATVAILMLVFVLIVGVLSWSLLMLAPMAIINRVFPASEWGNNVWTYYYPFLVITNNARQFWWSVRVPLRRNPCSGHLVLLHHPARLRG